MRIALASTPLLGPDGGDRQLLMLARELKSMGHDPVIFANDVDRERCYPELIRGLEIVVVPKDLSHRALEKAGRILRLRSMQRAGMQCLADASYEGFEILNGHNYYANWPAERIKRKWKIPAVWMCNEPPFWYHTPDTRYPFQRAMEGAYLSVVDRRSAQAMDAITVLDQKNAQRISKYYGLKADVVRSGVDADFFDKRDASALRSELRLEGKFALLLVGHASKVKGQVEAIRAVAGLASRIPNIHLVMVGGGVKWAYEREADAAGIRDRITLLEGLSDDRLAALYSACDLVVFPANQTWGLNVTEGMAAGRAVVVADQAGVSEIVRNGETGIVVPYGNLEALMEAIASLAEDDALRRRLGEAGRIFVREELTWRRYAERMVEIYERCLGANSAR